MPILHTAKGMTVASSRHFTATKKLVVVVVEASRTNNRMMLAFSKEKMQSTENWGPQ